jgi:hypothetical protein
MSQLEHDVQVSTRYNGAHRQVPNANNALAPPHIAHTGEEQQLSDGSSPGSLHTTQADVGTHVM